MRVDFLRILFSALLLTVLCAAAQGQRAVELSEGSVTVSFTPPPDCQSFSDEQIARLLKLGVPLKYGCITSQKDAMVMVLFSPSSGSKNAMTNFVAGFEDSQKTVHPDGKWLARNVVELKSNKWIHLIFKEGPDANNLTDEVYITQWADQVVLCSFSSPAAKYEGRKNDLVKSARPIELSVSVMAPVQKGDPITSPPAKAKP